jgi:hypothetical protein
MVCPASSARVRRHPLPSCHCHSLPGFGTAARFFRACVLVRDPRACAIHLGGRPRRLYCLLKRRSRARIASSSRLCSAWSSASAFKTSISRSSQGLPAVDWWQTRHSSLAHSTIQGLIGHMTWLRKVKLQWVIVVHLRQTHTGEFSAVFGRANALLGSYVACDFPLLRKPQAVSPCAQIVEICLLLD